jgi:hypothetical protein
MLTVAIDTHALAHECDELLSAIERASLAGLDDVARITASAARERHWYQNRTGDLESSTRAVDAEGDLWTDGAHSEVVAMEPYASYVDDRAPILSPAWDAVAQTATHSFEAALARACL